MIVQFCEFLKGLGFTEDGSTYNLEYDSGNTINIFPDFIAQSGNTEATDKKLYFYNWIGREWEVDRYELECTISFNNKITNSIALELCNKLLQVDGLPEGVITGIQNYTLLLIQNDLDKAVYQDIEQLKQYKTVA